MGRRLCEASALVAAVEKSGFSHLFGSALLRYSRGEKMFAIVGDAGGLKAVVYDVESVKPEKITLRNLRNLNQAEIAKWLRRAQEKKLSHEWVELSERTLRSLASQVFPGSFFYDIFINENDHVFSVLEPVDTAAVLPVDAPQEPPIQVVATA